MWSVTHTDWIKAVFIDHCQQNHLGNVGKQRTIGVMFSQKDFAIIMYENKANL